MSSECTRLERLVKAASNLAGARRRDDASCEEWDDLEWALLDAAEADAEPDWKFRDGSLVRIGRLVDGTASEAACGIDAFEQVALAIEGLREGWFVIDEVAEACERDWMACCVAVMFMIRCGLVRQEGTGRRLLATDAFDVDAAMAEFTVADLRSRER